jgi:cardiolipin synthase (CMP-forming)
MERKNLINPPNILSFYRILAFPFILYLAISEREQWFTAFLILNLITDILDGWIARRFNMQTEFGARLDSIADIGTYICAITGVFVFKAGDFAPHLTSFFVFISLFMLANILSLLKFRRLPSLHLYSWKIGGYMQGIFFFILFTLGFYAALYYLVIIWGILAFLEHIIIQLMIPRMQSNMKGLWWVMGDRRWKI